MEANGAVTATIELASVVATTIAQASTNVCQGGPSNSQRFKARHPPTLREKGNQWKLFIGSGKLARSWRLWRSPLMP